MHRLFVAIDLPQEVKESLVALQGGLPGARWVGTEGLHLTLRFIGEVNSAEADDIHAALATVAGAPFMARLEGAGTFSGRGGPRVVWAGAVRDTALERLKRRVDAALRRAGCAPEGRKFAPHVTLARLRGASAERTDAFVAHIAPRIAAEFEVTEFVLFSSRLAPEGAVHTAEAVYPLVTR